jgi:hypothetical protein
MNILLIICQLIIFNNSMANTGKTRKRKLSVELRCISCDCVGLRVSLFFSSRGYISTSGWGNWPSVLWLSRPSLLPRMGPHHTIAPSLSRKEPQKNWLSTTNFSTKPWMWRSYISWMDPGPPLPALRTVRTPMSLFPQGRQPLSLSAYPVFHAMPDSPIQKSLNNNSKKLVS